MGLFINVAIQICFFFSPFKPSSVKTKVEAFEAVLGSGGSGKGAKSKPSTGAVLPEARVLLRRLTDQDLIEAGVDQQDSSKEPAAVDGDQQKRGTFVVNDPPKAVERKVTVSFIVQKFFSSYW